MDYTPCPMFFFFSKLDLLPILKTGHFTFNATFLAFLKYVRCGSTELLFLGDNSQREVRRRLAAALECDERPTACPAPFPSLLPSILATVLTHCSC